MKTLRLALAALLLAPAAAQAQSNDDDAITPRSSSGDFALLFDLGGLADLALNSFNGADSDTSRFGAGFGAKYFVADDLALRLGLTLVSSSATRPIDSATNDDLSVFRFTIAPSVTYNVAKTGSVAGFVGGRVSFAMSSSTRNPADEDDFDVDASSTTIGVAALIGAEWFPWSGVSLSAEYQLGYGTSSAEEERTRQGTTTRIEMPSESSIGLGSRGVITAAIYW